VLQVFGALSLLLAGIGVYGVLAFSVAQRTREIAVRAALGAQRQALLRLVFGSGAVVVLAGLVVGVAGAIAGGRLIESMLFEVEPRDPAVLFASTVVIALVGAAAAIIPARRATRIDPMEVLRNE
jgi:ABC-type antimicrobial peptide transport system permease subunit